MSKVYNTGRVLIGLAYQPKPTITMDRDALRLQCALIDAGQQISRPIDKDGIVIAASVVVGVLAVLVEAGLLCSSIKTEFKNLGPRFYIQFPDEVSA